MQTPLETERLILRELHVNDAEAMFEMDSNAEVHRYLGNRPVSSLDQTLKEIEFIRNQYQTYGIGRWAVIEKEREDFIGWSGFKYIAEPVNNRVNYYDLGYRFIERYWGKGYAYEAAKAWINFAFSEMKISEIMAIADVENTGSVRVLEKAGLKKIEIFDYHGRMHHWMSIQNEAIKRI